MEGYTVRAANTIAKESLQRFGDRVYLFSILAFDYLIGNCDNHLKNLSMTWDANWHTKSLSPIYDVTCTTMYDDVSHEMGMGLGTHRVIDQIDSDDVLLLGSQLGIPTLVAKQELEGLVEAFPSAIDQAAQEIADKCDVEEALLSVASWIKKDSAKRREVIGRALV